MNAKIGSIAWRDLTVPDAERIRDFYRAVVCWEAKAVCMGDCNDYTMMVPGTDEAVAGVCHAQGVNADLPPQWLMYITVADVEASAAQCRELGGEVVVAPRGLMRGRFCVIRDPSGAVCALYAPKP